MSVDLIQQHWQLAGGLMVLALMVLAVVYRKVRKATRGSRADEVLANAFTVVGLGWSSEAMWEIATQDIGLDIAYTIFLFAVFEVALIVSMLRAKAHMLQYGWPGRYGRTVWGLAVLMGVVASTVSGSTAEVLVRFTIPLVVAKLWWDGVVGGARRPESEESSWNVSLERALVWLRLKKPGRNSIASIDRDRLARRMTKLEFARRYGPDKGREKTTMKIAKLTLSADEELVRGVLSRVSLASAFLSGDVLTAVPEPVLPAVPVVPAAAVRVSQDRPRTDVPAGQTVSPPTDDDLEDLVSSYARKTDPDTGRLYSVRAIAAILGINKNKVSELKRRAVAKLDNEIIDLTPGFFDYQKQTNGHDFSEAKA